MFNRHLKFNVSELDSSPSLSNSLLLLSRPSTRTALPCCSSQKLQASCVLLSPSSLTSTKSVKPCVLFLLIPSVTSLIQATGISYLDYYYTLLTPRPYGHPDCVPKPSFQMINLNLVLTVQYPTNDPCYIQTTFRIKYKVHNMTYKTPLASPT